MTVSDPYPQIDGATVCGGLESLRVRLRASLVQFDDTGADGSVPSRQAAAGELLPAAVLIAIIGHRDSGPSVLLTRRADDLRHHPGQISFPGGVLEAGDADAAAAALREAREEVGLDGCRVEILGALPARATVSGFSVTPVVGILDRPPRLTPDFREVSEVFEVPLAHFLDRRNILYMRREFRERVYEGREFHWEAHRIWGATATILMELRRVILSETTSNG